MLDPAYPPFNQDHQLISPVTQEAAEAVNAAANAQSALGRKSDAAPRARRKKNHQDDEQTRIRIANLGPDEQHIMKDYAGNTRESRLETLAKLEEHRARYNAPPMMSDGQLGPKKGKTQVEWICGLCQERKNTFQKIAGHVTSHHWKLKVWSCSVSSCGRRYCSLNELTRHTKETHRRKCHERANTNHPEPTSPASPHQGSSATIVGYPPAAASNISVAVMAPHPYSAIAHPARSHLSHTSSALPATSYYSQEGAQAASVQRHTRSARPNANPYPSRKPIVVRSQVTPTSHSGSTCSLRMRQPRYHQDASQDYYSNPSARAQYAPSQSVDRNGYGNAPTEVRNPVLPQNAPIPHSSARSVEGGPGTAPMPYAGALDAPSYPEMNSVIRYDYTEPSHEYSRYSIPESRCSTGTASQSHFQPQTHISRARRNPRFVNYDASTTGVDEESGGSGKASRSTELDSFDATPASNNFDYNGYQQSEYYGPQYYDPLYGFNGQSGTGYIGDETVDPFLGPYIDNEKYLEHANESDQVSRRSLYAWLCRLV